MKIEKSKVFEELFKELDGDPKYEMASIQFDVAEAICTKLDGRSYAWLARKMGCSRTWIHRVMKCTENLSLLSLCKIGKALGIRWKIIPTALKSSKVKNKEKQRCPKA